MRNEQIKLTANFLNMLANSMVIATVLTPLAALIFRLNTNITFAESWPMSGAGLAYAVMLHLMARAVVTWLT